MKILSGLLSLLLALPAVCVGQTATNSVVLQEESGASLSSTTALAPLTVTAPRPTEEEKATIKKLKATRAAGGLVAGSGLGLMVYGVLFAGAGPVGWAAGLIFLGGLTAYLSHRSLKGKKDFEATTDQPAPAPALSPATTAPQVPFPTDQPYGR